MNNTHTRSNGWPGINTCALYSVQCLPEPQKKTPSNPACDKVASRHGLCKPHFVTRWPKQPHTRPASTQPASTNCQQPIHLVGANAQPPACHNSMGWQCCPPLKLPRRFMHRRRPTPVPCRMLSCGCNRCKTSPALAHTAVHHKTAT